MIGQPELLKAIIDLRRLFDETIDIRFSTTGNTDGFVEEIIINTKDDAGNDVTVNYRFTYTFDEGTGKLKRILIEKTVSRALLADFAGFSPTTL